MIDYTFSQGIAHITLNRPQAYNALTADAIKALATLTHELDSMPDLRCVLITGMGDKAFCAGGDVSAFVHNNDRIGAFLKEQTDPLHQAVACLMRLQAPIIAAVNGVAAGVGLSLVALADLVIAADTAQFTTAYSKIGFTPDGGSSWLLPRLIGQRRAMELYLTNRTLSATEALEWGLINQVVPLDQLASCSQQQAERLAQGPSSCFGSVKRLLLASAHQTLEQQLALEAQTIIAQSQTAEGREGVLAFSQKRAAKFIRD